MRILLVDDHEQFVRTVIAAFLQDDDVVWRATVADARGELAGGDFDAVLVDFDLPDAKGSVLVSEIRARKPEQFIVAISAHEDGNAALLRAGANDACPKTQFAQIRSVLTRPTDESHASPMTLTFTAAAGPNNEDRALVVRPAWGIVVAVADGAGGSGAGAFAAETALAEIKRAVNARTPFDHGELAGLLGQIDGVLADTATGAETTCVVAQIVGAMVDGASVGDSGAMLIRTTGLVDLTAGQSRKPLLGAGCATTAFGPERLDGLLVVASDGLMKYAPRAAFTRAAASADLTGARDVLLQSVRLRSGQYHDDTTGILVR